MTVRDKIEEMVGWSKGIALEELETLKKALVGGQPDLAVMSDPASGTTQDPTSVTSDKLLVGVKAHQELQLATEIREGERMARRFQRVVSKMRIEPGDLLVLHVPDHLTERQFNRIAAIMNVLIAKRCPEACYIVLPEIVSFGKTIRTRMPRADVEEQLRALLGVLMADDEPIERRDDDEEED
jgi:hypothetical protein